MSKGGDTKGKCEEKRISGEAYDKKKQKVYTVPKSEIEPRVHYAPEPARGQQTRTTHCSRLVAKGPSANAPRERKCLLFQFYINATALVLHSFYSLLNTTRFYLHPTLWHYMAYNVLLRN